MSKRATTALHLVTPPAHDSKAPPARKERTAPKPQDKRATHAAGAVLGGFVPLASAALSHCEIEPSEGVSTRNVACVVLVLGALAYSFPSVYQLTRRAFGCPYKAAGFTLLLEGMYTIPTHSIAGHAAAIGALALLIVINAVKAATTLAMTRA
jgi:hypothetical protein